MGLSTGKHSPAMTDVAAHAGVSHQTVSRVLNNHPNVRPATRNRVEAAIAELGYRPNRSARALATHTTNTIGILMTGTAQFGPASTVIAIDIAARARGYFTSMASLPDNDRASALQGLDQLVSQGVDGIIVVATNTSVADAVDNASLPCPVVVVAARPEIPADSRTRYVYADQRQGARLAIEHLTVLGHRRIAHISGPLASFDAAERLSTYEALMAELSLPVQVYPAGDWSAQRGYEVGLELARDVGKPDGPTAVFCANDMIALGLLRALWEAGLRVPEDVSIVGFDDIEVSAFLVPELTTVRQPFAEVGAVAVATLLAELQSLATTDAELAAEQAPQIPGTSEPCLVVRKSTKSPVGFGNGE